LSNGNAMNSNLLGFLTNSNCDCLSNDLVQFYKTNFILIANMHFILLIFKLDKIEISCYFYSSEEFYFLIYFTWNFINLFEMHLKCISHIESCLLTFVGFYIFVKNGKINKTSSSVGNNEKPIHFTSSKQFHLPHWSMKNRNFKNYHPIFHLPKNRFQNHF